MKYSNSAVRFGSWPARFMHVRFSIRPHSPGPGLLHPDVRKERGSKGAWGVGGRGSGFQRLKRCKGAGCGGFGLWGVMRALGVCVGVLYSRAVGVRRGCEVRRVWGGVSWGSGL